MIRKGKVAMAAFPLLDSPKNPIMGILYLIEELVTMFLAKLTLDVSGGFANLLPRETCYQYSHTASAISGVSS